MDDNILTLVKRIEKRDIVLPDIQRSFVWDEDQIHDLFDSLVRGYPIGSLLFWNAIGGDEEERSLVYHKFVRHHRKGQHLAPQTKLDAGKEKTFVLDGQQRLQSLYLGLDGTYEGRELYVDLMGGTTSEDREKNVAYYVRFLGSRNDLKDSNRLMVRVKDFVFLPQERFTTYRRRALEESGLEPGSDAYEKAREVLDQVRGKLLQPEVIPIITIDAQARSADECKSLDEVAEIFVRVNDGGTKLSRMDLIFSLMKSWWIGASEAIEGLCQVLNSSGEFAVTKDFVIRCLMVSSGRSAQFRVDQMRRSDLMSEFEGIFLKAAASLRSTFDFLTQNRGAGIRTWRLLSGGQRADRGYNVLIAIALYL
jgi:hypothetical protein